MTESNIAEKLDSLARCLERLRTKKPCSLEALEADIDLQDIVSINMERAVQLCVDMTSIILAHSNAKPPQTMAEGFRSLAQQGTIAFPLAEQLVKAVGFRNLAVHAYDKIDWQVVYSILTNDVADLRSFGAAITQWLERKKG